MEIRIDVKVRNRLARGERMRRLRLQRLRAGHRRAAGPRRLLARRRVHRAAAAGSHGRAGEDRAEAPGRRPLPARRPRQRARRRARPGCGIRRGRGRRQPQHRVRGVTCQGPRHVQVARGEDGGAQRIARPLRVAAGVARRQGRRREDVPAGGGFSPRGLREGRARDDGGTSRGVRSRDGGAAKVGTRRDHEGRRHRHRR
mmetsp:Transcript_11079/g.44627  ORF Transcript_11079/g.44627 Transcript_11079/m.44627 type:complete len:200 (+) Transcript_11079:132-731(+)